MTVEFAESLIAAVEGSQPSDTPAQPGTPLSYFNKDGVIALQLMIGTCRACHVFLKKSVRRISIKTTAAACFLV